MTLNRVTTDLSAKKRWYLSEQGEVQAENMGNYGITLLIVVENLTFNILPSLVQIEQVGNIGVVDRITDRVPSVGHL